MSPNRAGHILSRPRHLYWVAALAICLSSSLFAAAPEANDDVYAVTTATALSVAAPGVLTNDVPLAGETFTAELSQNVAHGTLTLNANGSFDYTSAAGFEGLDQFKYNARDGAGNVREATVYLSVQTNPDSALYAWWRFDETTAGTALDYSGNNRHGTITGAPRTAGILGGALQFAEDDSYVMLNLSDLPRPWTLAAWVKRTDALTGGASVLTGSSVGSLRLEQWADTNKVGVTIFPEDNFPYNYEAPVGEWVHLVFVGTTAGTSLYVNGAFKQTANQSLDLPLLKIGDNGNASLCATLDDMRVYSRELSATEIRGMSAAQLAPVAHYKLDENGGAVVTDSSINARNGSLANGPTWSQGVLNSCLRFNGSNQSVFIPNSADVGGGSFTVTSWIYREGGVERKYVDKWNDGTGNFQFDCQVYLDSKLWFQVRQSNNSAPVARGTTVIQTGRWYHVAHVADAVNRRLRIYVNGVEETLQSDPGWDGTVRSVNMEMVLGRKAAGAEGFWHGRIDDVRVYNRTLAADEIVAMLLVPPVAEIDEYATNQNTVLNLAAPGVLGNDTEFSGGAMTAVKLTDPANGTLSFNANGSFTYTPSAGFSGDDSFTYKTVSANGESLPATVNLYVGLAGGLAMHLKLDEGTGTLAADSSGNGNHGTLMNGTAWNPSGQVNGALSFDGGDDLVKVARSSSLEPQKKFSIAMWGRISSSCGSVHADLMRKATSFGTGVVLRWSYMDSRLQLRVDRSTQPQVVCADTQTTGAYLNQWHHYAATWDSDAGFARLYVDGVLKNQVSASGTFEHADDLYLMFVNYSGQGGTPGLLDDVRMYRRALTTPEILALAQQKPNAAADSYLTPPNQALTVGAPGVLANDIDLNNEPLTAIKVTDPAHGTLTLNANGSFTYTPEAGFKGADSFSYKANDGIEDSAPATVAVLVNDLIAHYKLDENSGTVANDSSSGYNGTLANGPAWTPGVLNNALRFNGSNQYVNVPTSPNVGGGSFTVAAWIYREGGVERKIVDKWNGNTGNLQFSCQIYNDSKPWFGVRQSNHIERVVQGSTVIQTGRWYHYAAVADSAAARQKLYINGVEETLQYDPGWDGTVRSVAMEMNIGRKTSGDGYWQGKIDDIRIYNRALSGAEVAALANIPPLTANDAYSTFDNVPLNVAAPGVLANDSNFNGAMTAVKLSDPAQGTLNFNANGAFDYTPPLDFSGNVSFTYKAIDGNGESAPTTVAITVNRGPVRVSSFAPAPGTVLSSTPAEMLATTSRALNAATVSSNTVKLTGRGADNAFGTADDVQISAPVSVVGGNQIKIDLAGVTLAEDRYKLKLTGGQPQIAARLDITTAPKPSAIECVDVDGDGKLDLVVGTIDTFQVCVMLGDGAGNFAAPVNFSTGGWMYSITTADFNGDGKPDVATADGNTSSSIRIIMNTTAAAGTPSFTSSTVIPMAWNCSFVEAPDINGDGKPDLVGANQQDNSVMVRLNTTPALAGTPTFADPLRLPTASTPRNLAVGDVNADGKIDIVSCNHGSNSVSVFINRTPDLAATPVFDARVNFGVGSNPFHVEIGDLNGDGRPDIATPNMGSNNASVLLNTSSGSGGAASFGAAVNFAAGTGPHHLWIADVTGDGRPDISVANSSGNTVSFLANHTGASSFTPVFVRGLDAVCGTKPTVVRTIDSGGGLKIAVANETSNSVSILTPGNPIRGTNGAALDGEFPGTDGADASGFPSGNGFEGGDFEAAFQVIAPQPAPTVTAVVPNTGVGNRTYTGVQATGTGFFTLNAAPDGAVSFNGHSYLAVSTPKDWSQAKAHCESLGGYLVTITSAAENDFVKNLIVTDKYIGCSDSAQEGTWVWVTGEPFTYTNWSGGEPNDGLGGGQDFGQQYAGGAWDDYHTGPKPFVCEFEGIAPTVKLSRAGQADVPATSVKFVSSTSLTFNLNLNGVAPGAWNLVVTNPDGQSASYGFAVQEPPRLDSVAPTSGFQGTTVPLTIAGANLPVFSGNIQAAAMVTMDGSNDCFRIPSSNLINSPNITIEAWVKNGFQVHKRNGSPWVWEQFHFSVGNGGQVNFWVANGGQRNILTTAASIGTDWVHLAATFDGSKQRVYINGNLAGELAVPWGIQAWTEDWFLYCEPHWGNTFTQGSMSEFRFWKTARTQAQIQAAMNSTLAGGDPDLVARYDFSGGGPNITDTTGNGHNGTGSGGPTFGVRQNNPVMVRLKNAAAMAYASGAFTSTATSINCSIDLAGVPKGVYDVELMEGTLVSATLPAAFTVKLPAKLEVTAAESLPVTFVAQEGTNPAARTLSIRNLGDEPLNWTASDDAAWLSVSPASGDTTTETDTLTLNVDTTGLTNTASPYMATVTVTAPGAADSPRTIPVRLIVTTTTGLIAHYKLDETSGNTASDSSGGGAHGTLVNGPVWEPGVQAGGLRINGAGDYVSTPFQTHVPRWTLSVWAKSPASPGAGPSTGVVCMRRNFGINWNHHTAQFRGAVEVNVAGTYHGASFGTLLPNTWYHLTGTYDGENLRAYRNGVLISTNATPSGDPELPISALLIGSDTTASLNGNVDDVRLYNRVLSDAEVAVLADSVITDEEGNLLDGEFDGTTLPSGNGTAGGDFVSTFTLSTPKLTVTALSPAPGSTLGAAPSNVLATLSKDIDPATVSEATVKLVRRGADGTFDTADDVAVSPSGISLQGTDKIKLDLAGVMLPDDVYRMTLKAGAGTIQTLASWKLDASSGTSAVDSSGNSQTGTLVNGPVWEAGFAGNGLRFPDDNSYVEAPNLTGALGTADFSVSLRVKFTDSNYLHLIGNRKSTDHANFWQIVVRSDGHPLFEIDQDTAGTNYAMVISNVSIKDGNWHLVTAIRSGTRIEIHVDGVVTGTASSAATTNMNNTTSIVLGNTPYTGLQSYERFHGMLDEVVIKRTSGGGPGVTDVNGNVLDGEFSGTLPSGNGAAGGDFAATFTLATPTMKVTAMTPAPGSTHVSPPTSITVNLSKDVNAATVTTSSCRIYRAGPDATLGTADDVAITPAAVGVIGTQQIKLDLAGVQMPSDSYRVVLRSNNAEPSLFAHWKLNETSGTQVADSSPYARTGTLYGGGSWEPAIDANGLRLNGSSGYVDTGITTHLRRWTICSWTKGDSAPNSNLASGPVHRNENFEINWNHQDSWYRGAALVRVNGTWHAASFGPLSGNTWYHLAATYDGENLRAYKDGVLITDNASPSGDPDSEPQSIKLGRYVDQNIFFAGALDDIRIYDRAFTASEVAAVKNFQFDSGISDASGNRIDGEFSGTFPSGNDAAGGDFSADFTIAAPPMKVTAMTPAPGSTHTTPPASVTVNLSKDVNPASITAASCRIYRAGADGTLGTSDDIAITPASVSVIGTQQVKLDLAGVQMPNDQYRLSLAGSPAASALRFNGSSSFAKTPQWISGTVNQATFECWAKPATLLRRKGMLVLHRASFNDASLEWENLTKPEFFFKVPLDQYAHSQQAGLQPGRWYHIAGAWDGTQMSVYINGQLESTTAYSGPVNWNTGYFGSFIGGDGYDGWGGFFEGEMRQVRVWSVARTQAQIQAAMNQTIAGPLAGLEASYDFSEGSGQAVQDTSGKNRHGTLGASSAAGADDPVWLALPSVTDTAGNLLDGEFSGTFPSGNDAAGGDFSADFTVAAPNLTVTALSPAPGSTLSAAPGSITATLSKDIDPVTISASTAKLQRRGADGLFDTADDLEIPAAVSQVGTDKVKLDLAGITLPNDVYRVKLVSGPGTIQTIANWKLDAASGTSAVDSSGNSQTGTLVGGPVWEAGFSGNGLRFPNDTSYVEAPNLTGALGTADFSVSLRVKYTDANYTHFVGNRKSQNHANFWQIVVGPDGRPGFEIDQDTNATNYVTVVSSVAVNDGNWHLVRGVRSGTRVEIHVDGVLTGSGNTAAPTDMTNATSIVLGNTPYTGLKSWEHFHGMIDEVLITRTSGGAPGIRDLNGNALDGEFSGAFPSGNGTGGGDFTADLTINAPLTTVTAMTPAPGSVIAAPPSSVTVTFSANIAAATVNNTTFKLVRAGADGTLGTGDDVTLTPSTLSFEAANRVRLDLAGIVLPNNAYRLTLAGVGDTNGNVVDGEFSGTLPSGNGAAGGNFAADFTVNAPQMAVTALTPAPGSINVTPPASITVTLNTSVNPSTISSTTCKLVRAGADGVLGTGDDVTLAPSLGLDGPTKIKLNLGGVTLPDGGYRLTLGAGLADFNSNALDGEFSGAFPSGNGTAGGNFVADFRIQRAPVANAGTLVTNEDTIAFGSLSATGAAGATLTYIIVTNGARGTAQIVPGTNTFSYTPNLNANGIDSFTFKVNDGISDSNVATVSVGINAANDWPALISALQALPNPARVGQAVAFSVGISDVDGDTLTYNWNFGDGASAAGASVSHAYTAAGTYAANVTASDGKGGSVTASVSVLVQPAGGGGGGGGAPGTDTDGDGISDADEIAGGTNPNDPNSPPKQPLSVSRMSGSMSFTQDGKDGCSISGVLSNVPAGFNPEGVNVTFDIGGAKVSFTLDGRGRGSNEFGTLSLKLKGKRDKATKVLVFEGGDVPFSLKLRGGTWSDDWEDEGVDPDADASNQPMAMDIIVKFGSTWYSATVTANYSAKAGKGGKFKN